MLGPSSGNRYIFVVIILAIISGSAPFLPMPSGIGIGLAVLSLAAIIIVSIVHARSTGMAMLDDRLSRIEKARERSLAAAFINELIEASSSGKPRAVIVAELIASRLKIEKFAIFFREIDKFIPRVYSGFHPGVLNRPKVSRVRSLLEEADSSGSCLKHDAIFGHLFRNRDWEYFEAPLAYSFAWGRQGSVIVAADDEHRMLSQFIEEPGFSRTVWPFLSNYIRHDEKLRESSGRNRNLQNELAAARKDISSLNRDLNSKLLDLHSFVEISSRLYNILNEDQLFATLKDTVRERLGAEKTEILCSDGSNGFSPCSSSGSVGLDESANDNHRLTIKPDSGFCRMLSENPGPLILPVVSSGLENEPFLDNAIKEGFLVASSIRVGNRMGCVLLVSEKKDKKQYSQSDIDFLSTITNIASLSLENIRQFTTIEKLSYTDSMTGVHNYRYFYKRLIEEILRARRFGRRLALVILDIDKFKLFNDKYGHQTGDLVLKKMAGIITSTVRSIDVVSRYGGEEFCIIMPDTDDESCAKFIERLRNEIAGLRLESEMAKDDSVVTASVGGAVYPVHASGADRLIYCADMALLKAKTSGRNLAVMYRPDFTDKEESSIEGMKG